MWDIDLIRVTDDEAGFGLTPIGTLAVRQPLPNESRGSVQRIVVRYHHCLTPRAETPPTPRARGQ